ncbi:Eco57I restriction-modification methylase domain-containing protein [Methylomonas montana]|uniref:Eco57I restriction-modification methylase domain-containing protein n=1 Tax=Methylomonas montana TaxID=3058963 RepID=UPI002A4E2CDB|nr:DNA methyltransferase [Methylomonas montana]
MGETLRPDFALVSPAGSDKPGQAQMLIMTYASEQALDKPVMGKLWKATPATRMMELLHGADVPLGLVSNGEQWMLVYAPRGEITGYTSWYASLWLDEPITLRAFHSLLSIRRFFGVAEDSTLQSMLKESAQDQQEVTDQLGYQVREAVEVLVQSFDALDKESNRVLLKGVSAKSQYEAALTIMMRLVFLFSAEERDLLHLGKPLYDENYAVSTLQEQLQELADRYGEEVLERRYDAWTRLLATFRAVHGGVDHQDLMMQAYGGSLFDPDRYPFLEGRSIGSNWRNSSAEPLAVNNRVVLHLLNSLQRLRTKNGPAGMSETRRVSFRALGVEQIGHVYEGLLDHTAVRAHEVVLGIAGTRKKEPEILLSELEALLADSQDKLINFLKDETGRSVSALRKALEQGSLLDEHKLLLACGQDQTLLERLRPLAGIIRDDSFERPLVVLPGSVYVTAGTTRRSTGTHYTPPTLTEPVVQHTLEPLVYQGPAEGWPREQWQLKSPKQILALKVCDMAMGSGAFLVQVCRYLGERLVEAWENEEKRHPGEVLTSPEGEFSKAAPSERLIPQDSAERVAIARRVVADRCLYGVDINPMAVEMAKLSMWLITVDKHRPFTFLDHAFKCGDALLGITDFKQLENFTLRGEDSHLLVAFAALNLWRHIDEAKSKREALEAMPSDRPEQIQAKALLYAEAEESVAKLNAAADILIAVELQGLKGKAYDAEREASADHMFAYWSQGLPELQAFAARKLNGRKCFHWALAFPEIIENGGFNAFLGNPPFVYGTLAATAYGVDYMNLLQSTTPPWHGKADLVIGFYKRSANLIRDNGCFSFIATASILRGESLESGLRDLIERGWKIFCARSPFKWPGEANLEVVTTSLSKNWNGLYFLDEQLVEGISEELTPGGSVSEIPFELVSNNITSALGIKLCPANREISYQKYLNEEQLAPEIKDFFVPAIGGEELYELVDLSTARRSISPEKLNKFLKAGGQLTGNGTIEIYQPDTYTHSAPAAAINFLLNHSEHAFACGETSTILRFTKVPTTGCILKHKLIIFPANNWALLAVLQSEIHGVWAWRWGLRRKRDLVYSPKRCAATFPLPEQVKGLNSIAEVFYSTRQAYMQNKCEGLTKIYNRFHNPNENERGIIELRHLHEEMDSAVADAYGWQNLNLKHDFHETKQGLRYTICEAARREVLDRLLELNHQRYAEEVAAGLHDKKAAKSAGTGRGRKKKSEPAAANEPEQFQLF